MEYDIEDFHYGQRAPWESKKPKFDFYVFKQQLIWRINKSFSDYGLEHLFDDYRHVLGIKHAYFTLSNLPDSSSEMKSWFDSNSSKIYPLYQRFFKDGHSQDSYVNNKEYISLLTNCINEVIIPYAKRNNLIPNITYASIQPQEAPNVEPLEEIDAEDETDLEPEPKKKNKGGRPRYSKNKKKAEPKEIYMPMHNLPVLDSKIDKEHAVMAIADLVWRKEGRVMREYLDLLVCNEAQRKFLNGHFLSAPNVDLQKYLQKIENPYWTVVPKEGRYYGVLVPKRKRAGWYYYDTAGLLSDNREARLYNNQELAEICGIKRNTMMERLEQMSFEDAVWHHDAYLEKKRKSNHD